MVRRAVLALSLLLLADPAWTQNIDGQAGGGASLTVKENDNIPNVSGVSSISFTNGTVTDDGGGALGHGLGHADSNRLHHPRCAG